MPRIRAATVDLHKQQTRQALFAAALELFTTEGYEQATLADIAAEAGIGRTTFYDYFADKEDLLASLVEDALPQVIEEIVADLPHESSRPEQLKDLAMRMVWFVATDHTLGILLHYEVPKLSRQAQDRIGAAHAGLAREFVRIYEAGVDDGTLRPLPLDLAGRFIQDVIMSAAKALMSVDDPTRRFDDVAAAMGEFLLHGVAR